MQLGFLAACPRHSSLQEIAIRAAQQGFEVREVEDRVRTGRQVAYRTLRPLLVA